MSVSESETVAGTVHIQVPTPIWYRPMFAVTIVLAVLTTFFFALGQWQSTSEVRSSAQEQRSQTAEAKAQATEAAAQVRKLTLAQECRAQKSNDLNAVTSDVTGTIGTLVVLLASQDRAAYGVVLANLKTLSDQRAAAAEVVRTAVDDCKGP
jgi:RNA 3'-terminal phosphate cyclase